MDKNYRPGLVDALNSTIEAFGPMFDALADSILGVEIRRSVHVARGEIVRLTDPRRIVMHPLDAIEAEFPDDYATQLDETLAWILERAQDELDAIGPRLDAMVRAGELRQAERMRAFHRDSIRAYS